jgi:hypothetical protein
VTDSPELPDGRYDAVVVEVVNADDAAGDAEGWCRVELALLDGPHKGDVVAVRAKGLADRSLDLLGIPATLEVEDGTPSVTFEP